ncbi:MAG: hypothetical protein PWR20_2529 [Bacteroidales bacterium]|jgi:hypothetical protein|nr:hypothetical protein [Bacteroidales bacterium]MDN5329729.1 hypothetical protein [Bacteroidales bacterium]
MKTKFTLILLASVIIALASCRKEELPEPAVPQKPTSMKEMQVPVDFNWKTTRNLQVSITAKSNGLVEILDSKGNAYQKAFLTANKTFVLKFTVPTFEKSLKIKFNGKETSVDITSDNLTATLN